MKISTKRLKQIIKEETENVLKEQVQLMTPLGTEIYNNLLTLKRYIKDPTEEKEALTLYYNLLKKVADMDRELLLAEKVPK